MQVSWLVSYSPALFNCWEAARGVLGPRMSSLSRSLLIALCTGDSCGCWENSSASEGPPEDICCSSSQRDTQRSTSLHTVCSKCEGKGLPQQACCSRSKVESGGWIMMPECMLQVCVGLKHGMQMMMMTAGTALQGSAGMTTA